MKKKILIFGGLFLIIIIGFLVYIAYFYHPGRIRIGEVSKFEPIKNYTIKEVSDGKTIENKKAGLFLKVPLDWKVELKDYGEDGKGVEAFSSNAEIDKYSTLPNRGCAIGINIYSNSMEYKNLLEKIANLPQKENYKIVEISGKKWLEILFLNNEKYGKGYFINIPFKNRIYTINKVFAPDADSLKNCPEQIDKILQTVIIK